MNSEYGVKIRNMAAGAIAEVSMGVRDVYDFTEAMLTNSLFLDFLKQNGLKINKRGATRQVVGVTFDYGTRSYEEEHKHLEKLIERDGETEKLKQLLENCEKNKNNFQKISPAELRKKFYCEGFDVTYKGGATIHYKMLYRSVGKAKQGTCMFIDQKLYKKAHDFLWMGIKVSKKNAPIVELGAYSALVSSTIVDRIQINPDDVLILKDVDSAFRTNVISVETDEHKHCVARKVDDYEVVNTMFDGQALIDSSIFPEWADGYILLRQHFTKCAAFCSNIQLFFQDYFGKDYATAEVPDMFGKMHKVKDIKLITTNNAMKWLKLSVPYEKWRDKVRDNGSFWGIVKTSHESKLGDVQRMSYQMVNTLTEEIMEAVMQPSVDYVTKLKNDTNTYVDYLRRNVTFSNDYDVLVALYEQDHTFEQSTYWRNRKNSIINEYISGLKNGRLRQNADNCTIVGSPYAMLLHAVGEDVEKDTTLVPEDGTIQCYSERFEDGEFLAAFRSPMNSENNIGYLHNVRSKIMEKYFNLGKLCVAVNMNHTDFQCRENGADQDSDSVYLTNQKDVVAHVGWCYKNYPTVVNNIPQSKKHYDNVLSCYAEVDDGLAASQLAIGESSNLAQLALTYKHTYGDEKYKDYACILAVLAQLAIDSSKKSFDIDIPAEIKRIRGELGIDEHQLPKFWKATSTRGIKKQFKNMDARHRQFNKINGKINNELHCPMDMVYDLKFPPIVHDTPALSLKDFFIRHQSQSFRKMSRRIEELIGKYSLELYMERVVRSNFDDFSTYLLYKENFEKMVEDIRRTVVPSKYIGLFSWLIDRAFIITPPIIANRSKMATALNKNRPLLLKTLYIVNPEALLACFAQNIGTHSNKNNKKQKVTLDNTKADSLTLMRGKRQLALKKIRRKKDK